jgi:hypothetical protein
MHHTASEAKNMPFNGEYESGGRRSEIRWSSMLSDNASGEAKRRSLYTVVQINNVTNSPGDDGKPHWIRWPRPHILVRHYDGRTGDILYAEAIHAAR